MRKEKHDWSVMPAQEMKEADHGSGITILIRCFLRELQNLTPSLPKLSSWPTASVSPRNLREGQILGPQILVYCIRSRLQSSGVWHALQVILAHHVWEPVIQYVSLLQNQWLSTKVRNEHKFSVRGRVSQGRKQVQIVDPDNTPPNVPSFSSVDFLWNIITSNTLHTALVSSN